MRGIEPYLPALPAGLSPGGTLLPPAKDRASDGASHPGFLFIETRRIAWIVSEFSEFILKGTRMFFDEVDSVLGEARPMAGFGSAVREELCDRVRAEIASGDYETDEKLDAAVAGLAEALVQGAEDVEVDLFGDAGGMDVVRMSEMTLPAWMDE